MTGAKHPSASAISRWENEGGATKKPPRNPADDSIPRAVAARREATGKPAKKKS